MRVQCDKCSESIRGEDRADAQNNYAKHIKKKHPEVKSTKPIKTQTRRRGII